MPTVSTRRKPLGVERIGRNMYGHYPENSPNDTAIVIPAKAGIQFPAPAISLAATERPSSFSCFVVRGATLMTYWCENNPWQTCGRGDPCGRPSPLRAHFHPPVCRRQGCMDDSSENMPRPTVFVEAGFKPAPHCQRHPHTVIPAEAGIQSPAICRARTQRPTPFS